MPQIPVILFDLDGTLVDTERVGVRVIEKYFTEHGKPPAPADLSFVIGRPWLTGVEYLVARYPIGKTPLQAETEILAAYRAALASNVPAIPGSCDFMRGLSPGFRLGVVSGSRRLDVEAILTTLGVRPLLEHIVAYEDAPQGKPSPKPYLEALKRFQITASQGLVFEDSEAGIKAALAAGLKVVAVGKAAPMAKVTHRIKNFVGLDAHWCTRFFTP